MSIVETNKVDIVAIRPNSQVVKLVIADHLSWDNLNNHCRLIQDKINTYLEFIVSGQLDCQKYPSVPENPKIYISIAMKQEPTDGALVFLRRVEEFLCREGIKFEIECRESDSEQDLADDCQKHYL